MRTPNAASLRPTRFDPKALPPSPRYHRTRRGYRRPRLTQPGSFDGTFVAGVHRRNRHQHRSSPGTRRLSSTQDRSRAHPQGCRARRRSRRPAAGICCAVSGTARPVFGGSTGRRWRGFYPRASPMQPTKEAVTCKRDVTNLRPMAGRGLQTLRAPWSI